MHENQTQLMFKIYVIMICGSICVGNIIENYNLFGLKVDTAQVQSVI